VKVRTMDVICDSNSRRTSIQPYFSHFFTNSKLIGKRPASLARVSPPISFETGSASLGQASVSGCSLVYEMPLERASVRGQQRTDRWQGRASRGYRLRGADERAPASPPCSRRWRREGVGGIMIEAIAVAIRRSPKTSPQAAKLWLLVRIMGPRS
jgi:hypothetical protein